MSDFNKILTNPIAVNKISDLKKCSSRSAESIRLINLQCVFIVLEKQK